jgi:tetratricopeptide (TPR) repeat protein
MTTLKTEHYNISYMDFLPDVIDYPIELIKGLTEKLTENENGTNKNEIFKWVSLGKNILEKYTEISNKEMQKFRAALAWALFDMLENEDALMIASTIIKSLERIKEENCELVSSYYRLLSSAQNRCGEYKSALKSINKAITLDENCPSNYCVMGEIFVNENKVKNAEKTLKIAMEKAVKKKGEDSLHVALIYQVYSLFYWETKQKDKCLECAEKAYEIMRKNLGKENLYTVRCSFRWGIFLFCKCQYNEALKRMEEPVKILEEIFEEKNTEVINAREIVGTLLIEMNNYNEAFKYFFNLLFIINNNADLLLVLSYCNIIMNAPRLVCVINDKKIVDEFFLNNNNIEGFTNDILANEIYNTCELFHEIPGKFHETIAGLFATIIVKKKKT